MRDGENRRRGEDYGRENRRRGRLSTDAPATWRREPSETPKLEITLLLSFLPPENRQNPPEITDGERERGTETGMRSSS
ncbi:hypothetical protein L6452_44353 [Arctium lappa]|uniref:Uncharacterized protein n=1 Tax=Arctium lappa TaxID=4217 RepID=A0ACB8XG62_ARCLA|nr:hypothetical protein L6452_44353 [Arctium lappa]